MPAIQPARLKHQTAQLAAIYEQPEPFVKVLTNLLNFYADRTHRPGQGGVPLPLLESYQVPGPVLREIIFELRPLARAKSQATLNLSQRLWQEPILEFRLIASALIGQIPPSPPEQVVEVIQEWLVIKPEDRIMQTLMDQGMILIRREHTSLYINLAKEWLSHPKIQYQRYGLWALYYLAIDPDYRNLPEIFNYLTPFLRSIPNELRPDILNILQNLVHYVPQEIAFLLRQNLNRSDASDIAWLTRQLIQEFPQPIQDNLRESLRAR